MCNKSLNYIYNFSVLAIDFKKPFVPGMAFYTPFSNCLKERALLCNSPAHGKKTLDFIDSLTHQTFIIMPTSFQTKSSNSYINLRYDPNLPGTQRYMKLTK